MIRLWTFTLLLSGTCLQGREQTYRREEGRRKREEGRGKRHEKSDRFGSLDGTETFD
jgi:hypothetical protein